MPANLAYMDRNDNPTPDPAELWAQALELEEQARGLRHNALELAVERHHGILQYVADAIGVTRSGLRNLFKIEAYKKLGERAAQLRARAGYVTGTVPRDLRPEAGEE